MFYKPEKIDDALFWLITGGLHTWARCTARPAWVDLLREARSGWVFSNPEHEPLMFPEERAVALRRFLDLCERPAPFWDIAPRAAWFGEVAPARIRAACMEVWGVPFYAGRGSLTLCEPLALEGALTEAVAGMGYLTATTPEPTP